MELLATSLAKDTNLTGTAEAHLSSAAVRFAFDQRAAMIRQHTALDCFCNLSLFLSLSLSALKTP
jgi:hypothetical protein